MICSRCNGAGHLAKDCTVKTFFCQMGSRQEYRRAEAARRRSEWEARQEEKAKWEARQQENAKKKAEWEAKQAAWKARSERRLNFTSTKWEARQQENAKKKAEWEAK